MPVSPSLSLCTHLWLPCPHDCVAIHVATYNSCQSFKHPGCGYGEVPPCNDVAQPWGETSVDLVGPWTITLPNGESMQVHALTILDTTSTLSECIGISNKTSQHIAMLFVNHWLSRYPCPLQVIHDQETEFMGMDFQSMLVAYGVKSVPMSVRNPQAISIIKRFHLTVQDLLNVSLRSPPVTVTNAFELIDSCLAAAQHVLCSVVHQTLNVSPGALVLGHDMLLPIPVLANYNLIRQHRQTIIDEINRGENLCRHFCDYKAGDRVLLLDKLLGKLKEKTEGPFLIIDNGERSQSEQYGRLQSKQASSLWLSYRQSWLRMENVCKADDGVVSKANGQLKYGCPTGRVGCQNVR